MKSIMPIVHRPYPNMASQEVAKSRTFYPSLEVDCPSDFDEDGSKPIYGARMMHVLRPDASIKSFRDYADKKVIPC